MPASETAVLQDLLHQSANGSPVELFKTADFQDSAILEQLLEQAGKLVRSDPGRSRELALLCGQLAERIPAPQLIPRADYLIAQTYAAGGDFQNALAYIQRADEGYRQLGEALAALRTNLGRMHVLNEIGRYPEVLQAGQSMLAQLAQYPPHLPEVQQITTFTHNNLGICYRRLGRYRQALAAYEEAERLAGGLPDHLGDIRNNRGGILMHLGRVSEALAAYEAAATAHAQTGNTWRHAVILNNIGEAHLHLGHYTRSLAALTEAQRLLSALEVAADQRIGLLYRADVYLALNLYPEAVLAYEEVAAGFAAAGMVHYQAQALWGWGAALMAQARLTEAAPLLAEAAELFMAAGNVPLLLGVLLEQSALLAAQGQIGQARQMAQRADELVDGRKWPVQQFYVQLRLADLRPETAASHLQIARKLADSLQLPHLLYRLHQRLGRWHGQQGKWTEARRWFETAVAEIEQLRGTVAQEAMRVSFLHDKIAVYEDLLGLHLAQSNWLQAFVVAEQAKSRTLVDMLTGVIETAELGPGTATHLQMLQADLNAVYNGLLHRAPDETADWHSRAQQLEQEIRQLHLTSPTDSPHFLATTLDGDELLAQLTGPLVAYHVVGEEVMAFVVGNGRLQAQRHLCTVAEVQSLQQRLAIQWERFRLDTDFKQRHQHMLERSARRVLHDLYEALFAPLSSLLPPPPPSPSPYPLTIIPHGLLHQIPFHVLYDGQHYLVDYLEISYAPSATIWALCQQRTTGSLQNSLVMGVADALIPAVALEVAAVAGVLEAAVFMDEAATVATFKQEAPQRNVLHLAGHGLFRVDNPMFSSLQFGDGWLTAVDILKLRLPNSLVTLSACESGRGQMLVGDEVMGLTRAFLGAGAVTVVVSLWLVQDEATAKLMGEWYGRLRQGQRRAAALRLAQLAVKAVHPHPYYWAPFILVGKPD